MISEELLKSLIGLSEKVAEETLSEIKSSMVITRRDDESFITDCMFDESRIRVEIENGLILKASIG